MLRTRALAVLLGVAVIAGARQNIDVARIRGPWFSDGPSFELVVHDQTILFEFDMQEHAYRLDGDLLIVTYDDGEHSQRIVRLTDEEMEWESEVTGLRSIFYRKGSWERHVDPVTQPNDSARPTKRGWATYTNTKYGYEIQHPDTVEVRETGPEQKRDGATILLAFKEYEAPQPVLDVRVAPRTQERNFPTLGSDVAKLTVSLDDVNVDGVAARLAQYRWTASGELAFAEVYLHGVVFWFESSSGVRDFRETQWWEMVSTFRLRDEKAPPAESPSP